MNKKYLSVVLFGALLAASAGTFTSCKDYDDDIKGLQEQIDKSGSTITDLQTQLTTLKAAAEAAQATADAAKAAAVTHARRGIAVFLLLFFSFLHSISITLFNYFVLH